MDVEHKVGDRVVGFDSRGIWKHVVSLHLNLSREIWRVTLHYTGHGNHVVPESVKLDSAYSTVSCDKSCDKSCDCHVLPESVHTVVSIT